MSIASTFRATATAAATVLALLAGGTAQAAVLNSQSLQLQAGSTSGPAWMAITPATSFDNGCYPCASPINSVGGTWEAANSGWNSSASYNTSAWSAYGGGWANGSGITPFYARTVFTIGSALAGTFTAWADDDVQVWLNGHLVINDTDNTAGTGYVSANLLPWLVEGANVLALKAHNSAGGGYGASFFGDVTFMPAVAPAFAPTAAPTGPADVPEPASLALVGLALAGLAAARRRG